MIRSYYTLKQQQFHSFITESEEKLNKAAGKLNTKDYYQVWIYSTEANALFSEAKKIK